MIEIYIQFVQDAFCWLFIGLFNFSSYGIKLLFISDSEISVIVRDNVQTDLDNRTNVLIVSKYGKKMEVKQGVQAFYALSKF